MISDSRSFARLDRQAASCLPSASPSQLLTITRRNASHLFALITRDRSNSKRNEVERKMNCTCGAGRELLPHCLPLFLSQSVMTNDATNEGLRLLMLLRLRQRSAHLLPVSCSCLRLSLSLSRPSPPNESFMSRDECPSNAGASVP